MTFLRRRLKPLTQRARARIGKRILLDTTRAQLLFEDERHPWPRPARPHLGHPAR